MIISTLVFGDHRLETQVLEALGHPEVLFPRQSVNSQTGKLELMIAHNELDGRYFVDGEYFFSKKVKLYKLEPFNEVLPSGTLLPIGWKPSGEIWELTL